uniref:Uncharacterized protein n=1 Tax=Strongyloides venezuelensis TaxID=75913 RepID=A0A0K0F1G0_STRVS
MKFLITNFNLFVLLLLIFTTHNESIEIDNNPDKSIIGNRHYRSLKKYKRDTSPPGDLYKEIPYSEKRQQCTETIKEKFGDGYEFTGFIGLSEFGNSKFRTTYFNSTIKDETHNDMKNMTLQFTAYSNGSEPICQIYESNSK